MFVMCCAVAHAQTVSDTLKLDSTNCAVFSFQNNQMNMLGVSDYFKDATSATLSANELDKISRQVTFTIRMENIAGNTDPWIHLGNYKCQLVAATNAKGEKIVWINAFCRMMGNFDLHKEIIMVDDGGNCYFQIEYNLTTGKVLSFTQNGHA